ncbi:MAG: response regulator transcription factor [Oscillospiraceae bacterium]|jgi:DNA-binding response OmpR family regulator|nr:response regulator transcription factor [Oscillospiraceae bacterium]
MNLLIVEDEARLADALRQIVTAEKYRADVVYNGRDGLDYALAGDYDAVILDVMLPGLDGFSVAKQLRANKLATPVLMLTARDELADKITGLDCGADDYMTKPFAPEELLARLRALTRRQGEVVLSELSFADISLALGDNVLRRGDKTVRLGFKEREIMKILMSGGDHITPKETLISKVWGDESEAVDNTVEAHISFLRKKLIFLRADTRIETVRKLGYRLEAHA